MTSTPFQAISIKAPNQTQPQREKRDRNRSLVGQLKLLSIATAIAIGSLTSLPAIAQEAIQRVLTVTGQGKEIIAATQAQVNLGVEAQAKTAEEAQREVARRSDAVVKFLQSQNVEKLQTTGINLNPEYSYTNNKRQLIGYNASNSVTFKVGADKAGPLLDRAVSAGASSINGLSLFASEEAIAAAQKQALRQATQVAQDQANAVLEPLNLSAKEVIGIQVNGASAPPIPIPFAKTAALETASAPPSTPIIAGEQTVEATVTLQIKY